MDYFSGEVLTEKGFRKGYLGIENNKILDYGRGNPPKKPKYKGLIVPTFVNAHTHIGDSFIRNKNLELPKDIKKLVAPPDGLKHKLFSKTDQDEIIKGMKKSLDLMSKTGTKYFCDFRENGITGIHEIESALKSMPISNVILSRPNICEYNKNEIDLILKNSNGIGLSSVSDWDYSIIKKISKETRRKQKIFAIHASERIREDIDLILDLKPNFLVHMTKATESDLKKVKENNIPIVICPRSNSFFGMKPKYELLKKIGLTLLIGTDNCMINTPNILEEIAFIRSQTNVFSLEKLFDLATISPRKVLNLGPCIPCQNSPADFIVLDAESLNILYVSKAG